MYKIIKDEIVIDVIRNPKYVLFLDRNNTVLPTDISYAQGIISSDGSTLWHVEGFPEFSDYETVSMIEVTEREGIELENILKGIIAEAEALKPKEYFYSRITVAELQGRVEKLSSELAEIETIKQLVADLTELVLPIEGVI